MFKFVLSCTALLTSTLGQKTQDDEKMAFAFEMVRHGARAPLIEDYAENFTVSVGQLTPQGMRQRYLLGRYQRERYTEKYQLLDPDYTEGQIYIQSTDVNRTIMSGYSEILGIYPPNVAQPLKLSEGEILSLKNGRGLPPMKIRDASSVNGALGVSALPNGFVSVPITTYMDLNPHDDIGGCKFANDVVQSRRYDNGVYIDYWYIADFTRDSLATALNVNKATMAASSFYEVYDYSDAFTAIEFEGLPIANTFTENSYLEMRNLQKIELVNMYTTLSRRLVYSRILREPLNQMQLKVNDLLKKQSLSSPIKYWIYSGHDDQISNMMVWLHENNAQMDYVLYASTVVFELKFDQECVDSTTASESCFNVGVRWNGKDLAFDACPSQKKLVGHGCTYTEFKSMMKAIWYEGPSSDDLNEACLQEIEPNSIYFLK